MAEQDVEVDEDDARPFAPADRRRLRRLAEAFSTEKSVDDLVALVEAKERTRWLGLTIRTWTLWVGGTLAALYTALNLVQAGVKAIVKGGGAP